MKLGWDGSDQSADRFFHAPCCSGAREVLRSSWLKARGENNQFKASTVWTSTPFSVGF